LGFMVEVTSNGRRLRTRSMRTRRALSGSREREPCRGDLLHESAGARPAQRHGAVGYQGPCDPARGITVAADPNARSLRARMTSVHPVGRPVRPALA
jgi:hypothetical protein